MPTEEQRLREFEKWFLGRTFGYRRDKMVGRRRTRRTA